MSGAEVVQVIASVSELVRISVRIYKFLDRLRKINAVARESLKRIRHLHEVVNGVQLALESRKQQIDARDGSVAKGEEVVWGYIQTSTARCHNILLRIRVIYTPFDIENQPNLFDRAFSLIRFETLKKEDLAEHYSALNTQVQALNVNTQTLNTFISIGTSDQVENSTEAILDAIARLSMLYQKGNSRLETLLKTQQKQAPASPIRPRLPSIGVVPPEEEPNDVETMQGTLRAAMDLISTYDPTGESVIDRMSTVAPEDTDSGFESDEDDADALPPLQQSPLISQKISDKPPPRRRSESNVQHIHVMSKRVLDGCIDKYQQRVKNALEKDQVHTAEADLRQLMDYAQERKEKYDVPFERTPMQEQLALIYKKQAKHKEVFDVLSALLPERGSQAKHTMENSRHFQMIAETYYELWQSTDRHDDLDEAYRHALSAFTIREPELKLGDPLMQETAKLLADISEGMNKPVEAEVYRDMLISPPIPERPPMSPRMDETTEDEGSVVAELEDDIDVNMELIPTIKAGNIGKLRALLQRQDVDVDYRVRHGWTPLMYAFKYSRGSDSMPLALIEKGYTIEAYDDDGRSVLHQAAARADPKMIRLAIHRDAPKEGKDKSFMTPLLVAVKEGYRYRDCKAGVEALLEEGCDPKAKDKDGWTVLHHAAHNSATLQGAPSNLAGRVLESLLDRLSPSAIEAKDKQGYTPLLKIANSGHPITVGILLEHSADPNALNTAGRSPLHLAMLKKPDIPKYANVIKLLVDAGAKVIEDEHNRDDWKKFKHLLLKEDVAAAVAAARRTSEHSRRFSSSKDSFHMVERVGSMDTVKTTDSGEVAVAAGKGPTRRTSGLRKLFSSSRSVREAA